MIHGRTLFPECFGLNTTGGPSFETGIVSGDNFFERRTSEWTNSQTGYGAGPNIFGGISKVRYTIEQPRRTMQEWADLLNLFWTSGGRAYGMRFRDPTDWSTHPTGSSQPNIYDITHYVPLRVQSGTERTFQLQRAYNLGAVSDGTFIRDITRPMRTAIDQDALTVLYPLAGPASSTTGLPLWFDGIDFGVDYDSGQVRIYSHQPTPTPGGQILYCGTYHVPGNLAKDVLFGQLESTNDRVTVSGLEILEHAPDLNRGEGESYHGGWVEITPTLLADVQATPWLSQQYHLDPGLGHFQQMKGVPSGTIIVMTDVTVPASVGPDVPAPPARPPLGGPWAKIWNDTNDPILVVDHNLTTLAALGGGLQPGHVAEFYLLDPNAAPGQQWNVF